MLNKVTLDLVFLPVLQCLLSSFHQCSILIHSSTTDAVFLPVLQFSRQYHSTNVPYSFIHLPPTLYKVFLPVLPFPLSVSFHQCSIPIHSSTTDAVYCSSPSPSVSPVSTIPPMLNTHSLIYQRRCMFFSQYFSFPCQYHSTNAPYPFINLPPTLYNVFYQYFRFPCQYHSTNAPYPFIHLPPTLYSVFLPVLQFPLSVLFHQCSILIHSSTRCSF